MSDQIKCEVCMKVLTPAELAEFESICYDCLYKETGGLTEDNPYSELDFSDEGC